MKVIFLSLLTMFFISPQNDDEVRRAFHTAHINNEAAEKFNSIVLKNTSLYKDLHSAYLGASEILLSKFGNSPGEKLELFKSGRIHLEKAVDQQPNNIEIRLIRLIIQNNVPPFLGYNKEIEVDKSFILQYFNSAHSEAKKWILKAAENSSIFTEEELTKIK